MTHLTYQERKTMELEKGLILGQFEGTIIDSVQQPDGKIIATGYGRQNIFVARFNLNGSLDDSFGEKGVVIQSFNGIAHGNGVAIDAEGSIFVTGFKSDYPSGPTSTVTFKYNKNGLLDSSFNGSGKVVSDFGSDSIAYEIAVDKSGNAYVLGHFDKNIFITKYLPNGDIDSKFGNNGRVNTVITENGGTACSLKLLSDGGIVVAGWTYTDKDVFFIARYKSNGNLDGDFGDEGIVTTDFGTRWAFGSDVVVQPDGKYIVAGRGDGGLVARYCADGSLDSSFGVEGKVVTAVEGFDIGGECIAIQKDGKIIIGGYIYSSSTGKDFALIRYHKNGSLDSDFGNNGILTTNFGGDLDECFSTLVQPDGKIILFGRANSTPGGQFSYALARYNQDGTLDDTFDAYLITTPPSHEAVLYGDASDNIFTGGKNELIDGLDGIDTVIYEDFVAVHFDGDGLWSAGGGKLKNIERISFQDKNVALDFDDGVLKTTSFISVIAPALGENLFIRGLILDFFDNGHNLESLSEVAIKLGLAPDETHKLVDFVVNNVTPNSSENLELHDACVQYTEANGKAKFLAAVMELHLNIDVVGLQQNGMDYIPFG